jgi:hypothetical protein
LAHAACWNHCAMLIEFGVDLAVIKGVSHAFFYEIKGNFILFYFWEFAL